MNLSLNRTHDWKKKGKGPVGLCASYRDDKPKQGIPHYSNNDIVCLLFFLVSKHHGVFSVPHLPL